MENNKTLLEKIRNLIAKSDNLFHVEEDLSKTEPGSVLMLIFMRKHFLTSKSASDFKLGHKYYEFTKNEGEIINIRESRTMDLGVFTKGETYEIHIDKKNQTCYIKGFERNKVFEIFRRGGNIITHNLQTGKYFNQSKCYEVDEAFKKKG